MFKAAQARQKDRCDADVALPLLDSGAKRWLRNAVACLDPNHDWVQTV